MFSCLLFFSRRHYIMMLLYIDYFPMDIEFRLPSLISPHASPPSHAHHSGQGRQARHGGITGGRVWGGGKEGKGWGRVGWGGTGVWEGGMGVAGSGWDITPHTTTTTITQGKEYAWNRIHWGWGRGSKAGWWKGAGRGQGGKGVTPPTHHHHPTPTTYPCLDGL